MNFSKTTEYVFRILSFMAIDETKLSSADDIFENLKIPFRYLRKILINLAKSEIIISIQGKGGGYKISRALNEISLFDIVQATEGEQLFNKCFFGFPSCELGEKCTMHDKWEEVGESLTSVLKSTNLAELKETDTYKHILKNSSILIKNN